MQKYASQIEKIKRYAQDPFLVHILCSQTSNHILGLIKCGQIKGSANLKDSVNIELTSTERSILEGGYYVKSRNIKDCSIFLV